MMNMLPLPFWSEIGLNDNFAVEISAGMYSTTSSLTTCCSSEKRWSPSKCLIASTIESRFWRDDVVRMNDLKRVDQFHLNLYHIMFIRYIFKYPLQRDQNFREGGCVNVSFWYKKVSNYTNLGRFTRLTNFLFLKTSKLFQNQFRSTA